MSDTLRASPRPITREAIARAVRPMSQSDRVNAVAKNSTAKELQQLQDLFDPTIKNRTMLYPEFRGLGNFLMGEGKFEDIEFVAPKALKFLARAIDQTDEAARLPHGTSPNHPAYRGVTDLAGIISLPSLLRSGGSPATLGMNLGMNPRSSLSNEAKKLLKGRTDEEVARYIQLAEKQKYLAGLDPKMSGPKSGENWFPGANVRLDTPMSELLAGKKVIPYGSNYERPVRNISWDRLQGGTILPLVGDRTGTGTLTHILGRQLSDPVDLQGGKNFMRGPDGAWASEEAALKSLTNPLPNIKNPYGVNVPMAGTGSDFAHMTTNTLHQVWNPSELTKKGQQMVTQTLRSGKGVDGKFPKVPKVGTKEFMKEIEINSPLRKAYIQALDKSKIRKEGGPDMGAIRHALTDPDFVNVPNPTKDILNDQLMGWGVTDLHPRGLTRPSMHQTYNTSLLPGKKGYMGRLPLTPRSVVMRDWTRMRRGQTPDTSGDPRSLFTGPAQKPQVVDQELIDAIQGYHNIVRQRQ
tara:strand:+ start:469 stop:2034 length:1566 start_codon:yes stop_codon:yes gene_type:complete